MKPFLLIIFLVLIFCAILSYIFNLQPVLFLTAIMAIIVFVYSQFPEGKMEIKLKKREGSGDIVSVLNSSPYKLKNIKYKFNGRLSIPDMPTELDSNQTVEFVIGLSWNTGTRLDVEVEYRPSFGVTRKRQHIKTELV